MKALLLLTSFVLQGLITPGGNGVISGQLTSKAGESVSNIRVSAMPVPDPTIPTTAAMTLTTLTQTDSAGRFRLENIPPGRYYVVAGLVESPTYYPGATTIAGATSVQVTANGTVSGINFSAVAPAGVTVSGRVIRPAAMANTYPGVNMFGGTAGSQTTQFAADGSFQFTKVRPGTYTFSTSGMLAQQVSITVADKDVTGVELVVVPTVDVTGTLTIEGNGVRPRFFLNFSPFKGGATTPTGNILPNGTIRATLPEGEYRVGWANLPAGYLLKSITAGSLDLLTNNLKVAVGTPPPPIMVTLGVASPVPWVKVTVRVKGLPTNTSTGYRLAMSGTPIADTLDVPMRPDGSFEFPAVLPGSYTYRITPTLPLPFAQINIPNKDFTTEISIPPMKEITGHAVIEGIGQITPRLTFSWADPANGVNANSVATVLPDGTFRVTLLEGERRVNLSVPGYAIKSLTYGTADALQNSLKITASDTAEFRAVLTPGVNTGVTGGVIGGVVGGVPSGVIGGVLTTILAPPQPSPFSPTPAPPPPPPPVPTLPMSAAPQRIGGDVAAANLISSPAPKYPEAARAAKVQGVVTLQATISKEGNVADVKIVQGNPMLNDAAMDAVKQWKYKPQVLNGQAIEVITTVTVNFSMQ